MDKIKQVQPAREALLNKQLPTILAILFGVCLIYTIRTASIGWDHTINDRHSFRQSQTATTTYYMVNHPFKLAYETPILGKPWSIPMEFPIYQWIVARIAGFSGMPLDQAGRLVSLLFFLSTTIPLFYLLRAAGVSFGHSWLPLTLFIVSPFYIFWSRTFMIESSALFFSMAYLAAAINCPTLRSHWKTALAVVLGVFAGLAKVTTFLGYIPLVIAFLLARIWVIWRKERDIQKIKFHVIRLGLVTGIPMGIAFAWVRFADNVKEANPLAAAYLTSQCAHNYSWNYGTWDQKLSGLVWGNIVGRFPEFIGIPQFAYLLLGAIFSVALLCRRRRKETLICIGAYLIAPAIFTNLHFVHDYYANANAVFLIGAIGFAIVGLLESVETQWTGVILGSLAVASAIWGHSVFYLPRQLNDNKDIIEATERIRSSTPEDSVIICIGNDWSPLVSYYARRRALNFPMDNEGKTPPELVASALAALKNEKIGAIVLVEPVTYPLNIAKEQLREAGISAPIINLQGLQRF
jgi:hypothetical protein